MKGGQAGRRAGGSVQRLWVLGALLTPGAPLLLGVWVRGRTQPPLGLAFHSCEGGGTSNSVLPASSYWYFSFGDLSRGLLGLRDRQEGFLEEVTGCGMVEGRTSIVG